ncbi:hypothetical protein [Streptomyces sp. NBC_01750]|uniref:hypothetical protein n=1 Tax=Streptomyces sp. NBC_01750 TaxID=2975928 RepID=UPI002DD8840B|nr:hypothetical protein [Streptomyces sp. NBC_01750]WSD33438.1 hypothetical protein OG966_16910 [Streptomyces sp. NBC_01750]
MPEDTTLKSGVLALDVRRHEIGRVMGHVGPYVQMRPKEGGREWDALPEDVHALGTDQWPSEA